MKKTIIFFLFSFIVMLRNEASAQAKQGQELIDSLETVLKNYDATSRELNRPTYSQGDTLKVNILNKLSRELIKTGDYFKAKQYADDMLAISEKIDFIKGRGNAYKIGRAHV